MDNRSGQDYVLSRPVKSGRGVLEYFKDMQDIEDHPDQQDKSAAAKEEVQQVPEEEPNNPKE